MLDNPVRTHYWQGQFEDFGENAPYENLEHLDADELVRYLVWFRDEIPDAVETALDVQRDARGTGAVPLLLADGKLQRVSNHVTHVAASGNG